MKFCLTALAFLFFLFAKSQEHTYRQTDSLIQEIFKLKEDTSRILLSCKLGEAYRSAKPDTALIIAEDALARSGKIKFLKGEIHALCLISVLHREKGDLAYALQIALQALRMSQENHLPLEEVWSCIRVGNVYTAFQDFEKGIKYLQQANLILQSYPDDFYWDVTHLLLSNAFIQIGKIDSASHELQLIKGENQVNRSFNIYVFQTKGAIEEKQKHFPAALDNYRKSAEACLYEGELRTASAVYNSMAAIFKKLNEIDSAIFYAKKGLQYAEMLGYKNRIFTAGKLLAELYESTDPKESVKYYKIAFAANDSLYGAKKVQQLQATTVKEQERQREAEAERIAYQNKVWQYALLGGIAVFFIVAIILFRNNRQKQKANELLKKQKQEIGIQRTKAEKTLADLQATQQQLIQSEKMASLGELTAGIAHEIQNPLNFVNNFSEVSNELIDEMKDELAKGNYNDAKDIADDVKQNLEKINHHGKRADAIVKGMLQHSRSSNGKKELKDINALCDEYLRLSYHGLRAKDNSFNATIKTDFDNSIEKINIVPQDIGRVVLNLLTNAFYAVNERKNAANLEGFQNLQGLNYEPTVSVITKNLTQKLEIRVADNGNGIPQKILDKIFQPFFTTKPTGQGTGLGLSLSYDIIKAHGGELKVETKEGEGTTFIILLPANSN